MNDQGLDGSEIGDENLSTVFRRRCTSSVGRCLGGCCPMYRARVTTGSLERADLNAGSSRRSYFCDDRGGVIKIVTERDVVVSVNGSPVYVVVCYCPW